MARRGALFGVRLVLGLAILGLALPLVVRERTRRSKRRAPRILLGIDPLINLKYWAGCLRIAGYDASTFVYHVYGINRAEDFDHRPDTVYPKLARVPGFRIAAPFTSFLWGLTSFDVFVLDFGGGFLRSTWLRFVELPLLRLAGKEVIAIPYGSDVLDIRRCWHTPTKAALLRDYPTLAREARRIARRVRHYQRWASLIACGGNGLDFLDRADVVVASLVAIDTDLWKPLAGPRREGPVRILHAPNHRAVKGTELLVRTCEELRSEGLDIELVIKEHVQNSEIREAIADADIVASAFVMGYYELFAAEGMAMGKPVLNYWRPDLYATHAMFSYAAECPVVDCPPERMKESIKRVALDSDLQNRLGREGRDYVVRHHSYAAMSRLFGAMVERVWEGTPLPDEFLKPRLAATATSHQIG